MPESQKASLSRLLQTLVPIAGVTVAIAGIAIGYSYRKKELSAVYLGTEKVVSPEVGGVQSDLRIEFRGQNIRSLVKMSFVLRNNGAGAVRIDDVKEPVQLVFPQEVKLLNTLTEKTTPVAFLFHSTLAPDQNTVALDFLLLNSGDEAYFSVYVYNSQPQLPQLKGRIVDVRSMQLLDQSGSGIKNPLPFVTSHAARMTLFWSLFGFNLALVILFLGLFTGLGIIFFRFRRWTKIWKAKYDDAVKKVNTQEPTTRGDFQAALNRALADGYIPKRPKSAYETWRDFFQGSLVFLTFAALFGLTTAFLYLSPRAY
jgi:hypothetical protein